MVHDFSLVRPSLARGDARMRRKKKVSTSTLTWQPREEEMFLEIKMYFYVCIEKPAREPKYRFNSFFLSIFLCSIQFSHGNSSSTLKNDDRTSRMTHRSLKKAYWGSQMKIFKNHIFSEFKLFYISINS